MPPAESRPRQEAKEALLIALVEGQTDAAERILAEFPAFATGDILIAAARGDAAGVSAWLERDPAQAMARGGEPKRSPLIYACAGRMGGSDASRADCVRQLLFHGAKANDYWTDPAWPDGKFAALYAATGINNYPQTARVLLAAGANPNDGESIYHAAEHLHVESLEVLAEYQADFSGLSSAPEGNTPLYFLFEVLGAHQEHDAGARWLLDHGADPNVVSGKDRETALHAAVRRGYGVDLIRRLLECGADPKRRRADGRTALALAVRGGHVELTRLLGDSASLADVSEVEVFLGACSRAELEVARDLSERNPNLMARLTKEDRTIVFDAARENHSAALSLMGDLGFDLNLEGEWGETPLHVAAWNGCAAALRILIERGADVNRLEQRFHAPPIGWVAHGSIYCESPGTDHAACAEALLAAGAVVPPGTLASLAVMGVLKAYSK